VLRLAQHLTEQTEGAFDVTCLPLIELWHKAHRAETLPDPSELSEALDRTGWRHFVWQDLGLTKHRDQAGIDLGGIAKGYGIDQAVRAMRDTGAIAGLVDVGGDVRSFGRRPDGQPWRIGIRSPFDETLIATLAVEDRAVCTSGNYQRFIEIDGRRYSHIVDPRTGQPAEITPSVTVVAPTAAVADAWATALSVLGKEGLQRIPPDSGIEAMIVLGRPEEYRLCVTDGFERVFASPPTATIERFPPPKVSSAR